MINKKVIRVRKNESKKKSIQEGRQTYSAGFDFFIHSVFIGVVWRY